MGEDKLLIELIARQIVIEKEEEISIPLSEIDWNLLYELSIEHKIFPFVYKCLKNCIPNQYQDTFRNHYYRNIFNTNNNINELKRIISEANNNKIDTVLIKGLALSTLIYDDIYSRYSGDIDILVNDQDILSMEKVMLNLEYKRNFDLNEKFSGLYKEMLLNGRISTVYSGGHDFHEVNYIKEINNMFVTHVEIKRATSSIPQKYIKQFLESTQTINISNYQIKTLNTNFTLIHLFSNAYENTENSLFIGKNMNLRDYLDLYLFIKKYKHEIDWEEIYNTSLRYSMLYKIKYIINNLNLLFKDFISEKIVNKFNSVIEPEGSPLNSGAIVQWETGFLERLFSLKKDLRIEFFRLFKQRCYSDLNKNYLEPYNLNESKYVYFEEDKYQSFSFYYRFSIIENDLAFSIKLSKNLTEQINRFGIIFTLMDNGTNDHITYKNIFIKREGNKFISHFTQNNFVQESVQEYLNKDVNFRYNNNEELEMSVIYSFEELSLDLSKSDNILCYNIALREEVLPDLYQFIGVKFPQFNLGTMEILT